MIRLTIDPEIRSLIQPLTPEERQLLEENIRAEGCRDALVVWAGRSILLDGHNRLEICQENGLPYRTTELAFEMREDAINWVINNQLGRRNLTPEAVSYLRGKRYQTEKTAGHGTKSVHHFDGQNQTAKRLAEEFKVSKATVERDGDFALAVDTLAAALGDDIRGDILGREARLTKADTQALADLAAADPDTARSVVDQVRGGEIRDWREAITAHRPHVTNNSGNNDWYTPSEYVDAARRAMGAIDCDPASSEQANQIVRAATFYTEEDNGLDQVWRGRVWMNPPYSQSLVPEFCDALTAQLRAGNVTQACVLVNNATETNWFQTLFQWAEAVCFIRGRVRFLDRQGQPRKTPLQGQAVLYFGRDVDAFAREFSGFGAVVYAKRQDL